jgi:hypothetical protein
VASFIACRTARDVNVLPCACGATGADACKAAKLHMCDTRKSVQESACQKARCRAARPAGSVLPAVAAANSKQRERQGPPPGKSFMLLTTFNKHVAVDHRERRASLAHVDVCTLDATA